jgi:hypothetical protein
MSEPGGVSDQTKANAPAAASIPVAGVVGETGTVKVAAHAGDVIVALPAEVSAVVLRIAGLTNTSFEKVISDALALQEAVTMERQRGARVLIERHGNVEELAS